MGKNRLKKIEKRSVKQTNVTKNKLEQESIKTLILQNIPLLLLIFTVVFLIYGNTLRGEFLTADDIPDIVQNPKIHNFQNAVNTFNIDIIVKSALYNIFGSNPMMFHARSIIMHGLNGFLIFLLFYYLTNQNTALYACMLFLVHPITSETVSWISAGVYLYYAFFALVTLLCFVYYRKTRKLAWLISTTLIYFFHLLSLQSAWILSLPLVLILMDLFILKQGKKGIYTKARDYAFFIIPTIVFLIIWLPKNLSQRLTNLETLYEYDLAGKTSYLQRIPYTIYKTLELYIFPNDLTIYHEGAAISKAGYFLMSVVAISLGILISYLGFKSKKFFGYIVIILALMTPVLLPYAHTWFIADRYLYLGAAFYCLIVVILATNFGQKINNKDLSRYVFIVLFVLYSARTLARTHDWISNKSLWHATQAYSPLSPRVYNNLGDVYSKERNFPRAIKYFKTAVILSPKYFSAIHNLGFTYMQMGQYEPAKKYLQQSLQINPNLYQAYYKLGLIEYNLGNYVKSQEYATTALNISPNNPEIQSLLRLLKGKVPTV